MPTFRLIPRPACSLTSGAALASIFSTFAMVSGMSLFVVFCTFLYFSLFAGILLCYLTHTIKAFAFQKKKRKDYSSALFGKKREFMRISEQKGLISLYLRRYSAAEYLLPAVPDFLLPPKPFVPPATGLRSLAPHPP